MYLSLGRRLGVRPQELGEVVHLAAPDDLLPPRLCVEEPSQVQKEDGTAQGCTRCEQGRDRWAAVRAHYRRDSSLRTPSVFISLPTTYDLIAHVHSSSRTPLSSAVSVSTAVSRSSSYTECTGVMSSRRLTHWYEAYR